MKLLTILLISSLISLHASAWEFYQGDIMLGSTSHSVFVQWDGDDMAWIGLSNGANTQLQSLKLEGGKAPFKFGAGRYFLELTDTGPRVGRLHSYPEHDGGSFNVTPNYFGFFRGESDIGQPVVIAQAPDGAIMVTVGSFGGYSRKVFSDDFSLPVGGLVVAGDVHGGSISKGGVTLSEYFTVPVEPMYLEIPATQPSFTYYSQTMGYVETAEFPRIRVHGIFLTLWLEDDVENLPHQWAYAESRGWVWFDHKNFPPMWSVNIQDWIYWSH